MIVFKYFLQCVKYFFPKIFCGIIFTGTQSVKSILENWNWKNSNYFREMLYSQHSLFMGLVGKWAGPGSTAMPGQPVTEPEQAPELYPLLKISLISKGGHAPRIRY